MSDRPTPESDCFLEAILDKSHELKRQRDELMEALQGMLDGYDDSYTQDQPPNQAARAAIASVKGATQ